jgi:hypothetical protein
MRVQYFKVAKPTHRWRDGQKVWIKIAYANHLLVRFKWRGRGRMVNGTVDRFSPAVGEIKTIELEERDIRALGLYQRYPGGEEYFEPEPEIDM